MMLKRTQQSGFTLLELMISAGLGIFLIAGLATLFVQSNRIYRQNDIVTAMQDQARFSLQVLSRDLMSAGYWGGISDPSAITTGASTTALTAANDCGPDSATSWAFAPDKRIEFLNNASASNLSAAHHCVDTSTFVAGTDVVALRRVATHATNSMGAADTSTILRPNNFYLQSNSVAGSLIRVGSLAAWTPAPPDLPLSPPMSFYKFIPRIYYVRDWAFAAGDGVPMLCRMELRHTASPQMEAECLAVGVQDVQLTWGLDTDSDEIVDRYKTAPTAAELDSALSVRVQVLMRSRDPDTSYINEKSYSLGDATHSYTSANQDHFLRRVYSTTILLRNRYW